MVTEYLSVAEARRLLRAEYVELVCAELQQFAKFVSEGLTSDQAAAAFGAGPATADLYEDTLRELLQLAANTVHPRPRLEAIQARTRETAPAATDAAEIPEGNHS